jgi:hypothetical protein
MTKFIRSAGSERSAIGREGKAHDDVARCAFGSGTKAPLFRSNSATSILAAKLLHTATVRPSGENATGPV